MKKRADASYIKLTEYICCNIFKYRIRKKCIAIDYFTGMKSLP